MVKKKQTIEKVLSDTQGQQLEEYKQTVDQAMEKKIKDVSEFVFVDILKFDAEKIEKVAWVINTTLDIMKFKTELPNKELEEIDEKFLVICDRRSKQKEKADRNITIDPNQILRAKSKIVDMKIYLTRSIAYYKTLVAWFTINRRATRSATSIAIRQFSKDLDSNIKKLLTVSDSENFGELLSSQMHLWWLQAEYITNYLNWMNDNMKIIIEDMTTVINQIKFDMKLWWLT